MRLTTSIPGAVLFSLLALSPWPGRDEASTKSTGQVNDTQQPGAEKSSWQRIDAGAFSILAPSGWKFRQLQGVDSYVGEFTGDGVVLRFDFGRYSSRLTQGKNPVYIVIHKTIDGRPAKIVAPKTPGHGITGIYFPRSFGSNKLSLFGRDLSPTQQELALKVFETIQFGSTVPPILPPPAKVQ